MICSGSLLGIHYKRIESNSVGYKTDYNIFSMDFEEFLWAKGYDRADIENMLTHMEEQRPFNETEMKVYGSLLLDYSILGGMPAVVREYIQKGTFEGTLDIQRQLLEDYREDIRKYTGGMDQTRILNFPELPLRGNYDGTKYKIYFFDTGLFVAMLDEEAQEDLRVNKNLDVYKGALYENIIGEALTKCGYELYYYKREDSTLEEDFFVRTRENLIPVEVKAKRGTAKSLRTLIQSDKYPDIQCGIKFTAGNIGYSNKIYTFPYFCAFLLKDYLKKRREV